MASPGLLWALAVSTCLGSSVAQTVTQSQPEMSVREAGTVTLDCTYDTRDSNYYLSWYKQPPSRQLILIIHQEAYKHQNATENRFSVNFQKAAKIFSLKISDSQLGDAAMYFCAHSNTGYALSFGKGTSLLVTPVIQDPDPAVYQLKDSKSSNNSICLFTDFDSQVNVSHVSESETFISEQTVTDMRSMSSKSNSILAWSSRTDFNCTSAFNSSIVSKDPTLFFTKEQSCDAKLVEKSFETDMNLNFQNLSVIGFRILLLKVVGFNLLMTLRLWSS
ncbi:T cell receptor alpha chain MC.7.G5-like [Cynocephalus volans]|uniref:T cell receptor alpha chain MC.7.G5-like n=1 Tax=Cynocephalus volans TaxID=110931 RepID=UPI002FCA75EE